MMYQTCHQCFVTTVHLMQVFTFEMTNPNVHITKFSSFKNFIGDQHFNTPNSHLMLFSNQFGNSQSGVEKSLFKKFELFEIWLHIILLVWLDNQTGWDILRLLDPKFKINVVLLQYIGKRSYLFLIFGLKIQVLFIVSSARLHQGMKFYLK